MIKINHYGHYRFKILSYLYIKRKEKKSKKRKVCGIIGGLSSRLAKHDVFYLLYMPCLIVLRWFFKVSGKVFSP